MEEIDETDSRIIKALQNRNSCSPKVTQIAEELEMPPSSLHSRIKKLEKRGIIDEYSANINPEKVGKELTIFALIKLKYPETEEEIGFDEKVADEISIIGPEVQEVHSMTGEWELIAKIRVKDYDEYYEVAKDIIKAGKIEKVNALFALKTHREHNTVYP